MLLRAGMKRYFWTLLGGSLLWVLTAFAVFAAAEPKAVQPKCYTPQQYRAEQAVRYQTQLMVAGMLCQQQAGQQIYSQYQGFSLRNQDVINRAENQLIGFFRVHGGESTPERSLHSLRTNLANELSMRAMQQSIDKFCAAAIPRVKQAAMMQPRQFEKHLMDLNLTHNSTAPVCMEQQPKLQQVKATVPAQSVTPQSAPAQPKAAQHKAPVSKKAAEK
jgi:hypothetical protein